MSETDQFYQKLPYTLQQNQLTPEYVIFGTGLQQTLIAAYKSKMQGKIGLIIDTDKTYGSALKTLTFRQFNQLSSHKATQKMYQFMTPKEYLNRNEKFYSESFQNKKHRGYSIDIEPSIFLAASTTCQMLKEADMDKYMDFHLVKSILHLKGIQFKHVPLSKGKIFESTELSLLQKKNLLSTLHKLMKIYQKYMQVQLDMNSTKQFDKDMLQIDQSLYQDFLDRLNDFFLPFIEKLTKKSKKIIDYLGYIICNYQYNYDKEIPQHAKSIYSLKGFITRFGKFIKSCGIYGQIPYLYVDNGIGDIPQAYSRIASIFASVYILHPKVEITSISQSSPGTFEIATNLSPQKPLTTKELYFGPTHLQLRKVQQQFTQEKILRVLVLSQKLGNQPECPSICFIGQLPGFRNPTYMFSFDNTSHSCPNGLILYQFQTIVETETQEQLQQKGQQLLTILASVYGQKFRPSIRYYSVYIRTRRYPKQNSHQKGEGIGLNDTMGIDLDQHFEEFIQIVGQQEHYFKKQNPNQPEDEDYGDDTKFILDQMDSLNIHNAPLPTKKPQTLEIHDPSVVPSQTPEPKTQQLVPAEKKQAAQNKPQEVQKVNESSPQLKEELSPELKVDEQQLKQGQTLLPTVEDARVDKQQKKE